MGAQSRKVQRGVRQIVKEVGGHHGQEGGDKVSNALSSARKRRMGELERLHANASKDSQGEEACG